MLNLNIAALHKVDTVRIAHMTVIVNYKILKAYIITAREAAGPVGAVKKDYVFEAQIFAILERDYPAVF